ncbi:pyridoxamine 5'-phosphate oxidase family protein [Planctomycetota bacterium]
MTDDAKKEVFSIIQSFNRACVAGQGFDKLSSHLHEQMVGVRPNVRERAQGKEINLKSYEEFCSQANIKKMTESDEHVDVFGSTAIAYYKYECEWEYQGSGFDEDGHELVVFTNENGHWQIAWRTLIPGKRLVDGAESDVSADCETDDIKKRCLALIEQSPACQLTTIDVDGFPHTTAMNNLRFKQQYPALTGLFEEEANPYVLYMSTSMNSNKMARIQGNPKVSAYFCNPPQFHGLMLGGEIEIIMDQDLKNKIWQEGWTMYYPNGPEGPEYGIIKLVPTVAKGWNSTGPFELL